MKSYGSKLFELPQNNASSEGGALAFYKITNDSFGIRRIFDVLNKAGILPFMLSALDEILDNIRSRQAFRQCFSYSAGELISVIPFAISLS